MQEASPLQMSSLFSLESYYHCLKTQRFGRPCIYLDKVSSTIDVIAKEHPNTLVLAKEQTCGRGQRTNTWQSLVGCAMASIRLECPNDSQFAKRICFLQHIVAMSASRTLEAIDPMRLGRDQIGLKWPNDIIYKKDYLKIGGVLVNALDLGHHYDIIMSFGLNVDNREPTTCVNEILAGTGQQVTIDSVVASIMNNLEKYSRSLEDVDNFDELRKEYETQCLQVGKVVLDETVGTVKVTGVNDEGYLIGKCETSGRNSVITKII